MKNTTKLFGIIAFLALIMILTIFISCGGSSISGTFYDPDNSNHFITFKGKNWVGCFVGRENETGTFTIEGDRLTIKRTAYSDALFRIIDKNTIATGATYTIYWEKKK